MNAYRWRLLLRTGQVLVTITLMFVLLGQVEWSILPPLFANARWSFVAVGVSLLLGSHLVNVWRWQYLLHEQKPGFVLLLLVYAAGVFSNNFLPTGIGGDGVRVALLGRTLPLRRAMFSVVLDRGVGLIGLSGLMVFGLCVGFPPGLGSRMRLQLVALSHTNNAVIAIMLVVLAILVCLGLWSRFPWIRASFARIAAGSLEKWRQPQWSMTVWFQRFTGGYLLSIASHLCLVAATWFFLHALQIAIPGAAAIWLVLIGSLSLLFPVAVNGLGVFEGVYVVVLGSYHISASAALGAVLFLRVVMTVLSLAGGLALLHERMPVFEFHGRSGAGDISIK